MSFTATLYVYYNAQVNVNQAFPWSISGNQSGNISTSTDFTIAQPGTLTLTGASGTFRVKGNKFVNSRSGDDTTIDMVCCI